MRHLPLISICGYVGDLSVMGVRVVLMRTIHFSHNFDENNTFQLIFFDEDNTFQQKFLFLVSVNIFIQTLGLWAIGWAWHITYS